MRFEILSLIVSKSPVAVNRLMLILASHFFTGAGMASAKPHLFTGKPIHILKPFLGILEGGQFIDSIPSFHRVYY